MPTEKAKSDEVQTHEIKGMEIFEAGTWNGDTYTVKDIDEMVRAYNEIGGQLKPYLKLGHNDGQEMLKKDGLPAAGWLSGLRRDGQKLVSDWVGVPQKIYDLIKRKAYARRSAEILWNLKVGDKLYPFALKAVALLGGETPAVQTLDDALALYAACGAATTYADGVETRAYDYNPEKEAEMEKELEALKARNAELEKKVSEDAEKEKQFSDSLANAAKEKEALVAEGAALKARAEASEAKVSEYTQKAALAEASAAVEKLIVDKKIMPAQKEATLALILASKSSQEKSYSMGESKLSLGELVEKLFADATPVQVPTEEVSETGKPQTSDLAKEAQEYANKNNVSIKEATLCIAREKERKAKA